MEETGELELLKQELGDKQFDERALRFINNFIKEFDDLFGKYVTREEVIKRIRENLNKITFSFDFGKSNINGRYNPSNREIYSSKELDNDEEMSKSVFFHEMVHVLTADMKTKTCGFTKIFEIDGMDEEIVTAKGLTEGFTQYVTKIRDKKYAPNLKHNSYPVLTEQTANLANLVGDDKFLECAFNRPQEFIDELSDKYDVDMSEFLDAFDVIWQEEDKIVLGNILFKNYDSDRVKRAKNTVIGIFEKLMLDKPITTIAEFNRLYSALSKYKEQLNSEKDFEWFQGLISKLDTLRRKMGISMEDILTSVDGDIRQAVEQNNFFESFKALSREEKIERMVEPSFKKQLDELDVYDNEQLQAKLAGTVIETDSQYINQTLFFLLTSGLAQIIKDNNWNTDRIGLEYINLGLYQEEVFNLFDTDLEESTYLGTFSLGTDDNTGELKVREFSTDISKEKRAEILKEYPYFNDMLLLGDESGRIIVYGGDGIYYGENGSHGEAIYYKSKLDTLQEQLKQRLARVKQLLNMNAPRVIINTEMEKAKERGRKISAMTNKTKILPNKIAELTQDISPSEITKLMESILNAEEKTHAALRRQGFEYGE